MSGPLVIKVGGSTLGAADTSLADIAELARAGEVPVVVHGGGAEATRWLERLGIRSRFVRGRRVTDEEALPVVVAVFSGLVNKRLVAALNSRGAASCGLSGVDGSLLECEISDPELGLVGQPKRVETGLLEALLDAGVVPVIACLGFVRQEGRQLLVNVNADLVAAHIAAALEAEELLFLTDVEGVQGASGDIIRSLRAEQVGELMAAGVISGGMVPKVEAALAAVSLGVPARIVDGRKPGAVSERASRGTVIVP